MDKWLKIAIKWVGSSVSGLVVIVGLICLVFAASMHMFGKDGWGIFAALGTIFVIMGLAGALIMTAIIRGK